MIKTEGPLRFTRHSALPRQIVDRRSYILRQCNKKRVLHVGCVDYATSENWEQTVYTKHWLHGAIQSVAEEVIGIDSATDAVSELRERFGFMKIFQGKAEAVGDLGMGCFDVIVAGELIEHMSNPGLFLDSAHSILKRTGTLVITTVNAYCARRFVRVALGKESIHPDHVAYYSHATLGALARAHGYAVAEQCNYRLPNKRPLFAYAVERIASTICPNVGEGLICTLKQPEPPSPVCGFSTDTPFDVHAG